MAPDGRLVFVTYRSLHVVAVVDPSAREVIRTIAVGRYPSGIALSPDGAFAYVGNEGFFAGEGSVSVVDTARRLVTATIDYPAFEGDAPSSVAIADLH